MSLVHFVIQACFQADSTYGGKTTTFIPGYSKWLTETVDFYTKICVNLEAGQKLLSIWAQKASDTKVIDNKKMGLIQGQQQLSKEKLAKKL